MSDHLNLHEDQNLIRSEKEDSPINIPEDSSKLDYISRVTELLIPKNLEHYSSSAAKLPFKDPRPIREKRFHHECIKNILTYIQERGYVERIDRRSLLNPTFKTFESVFKYLYSLINPFHQYQPKIATEIHALLKTLHYPYGEQIQRSTLAAVASPSSWPILLSVLDWLVNLNKCLDNISPEGSSVTDNSEELKEIYEHSFFDDLSKEYNVYKKASVESYEQKFNLIEASCDQKKGLAVELISERKRHLSMMQAKHEESKNKLMKLISIFDMQNGLLADRENILNFVNCRAAGLEKKCEKLRLKREELAAQEIEVEKLKILEGELERKIGSQTFSIEDLERLKKKKATFESSIVERDNEISKAYEDKDAEEIQMAKTLDELEAGRKECNLLLHDLGLILPGFKDSNGADHKLQVYPHAQTVEELFSLDLKHAITGAVIELKKGCDDLEASLKPEVGSTAEKESKLLEVLKDKDEEIHELDLQLESFQKSYEEISNGAKLEHESYEKEISEILTNIENIGDHPTTDLPSLKRKVQELNNTFDTMKKIEVEKRSKVREGVFEICDTTSKLCKKIFKSIDNLADQIEEDELSMGELLSDETLGSDGDL